MKKIKIIKLITIVSAIFVILLTTIWIILCKHQNYSEITFMNSEAKLNYKYFVSNLINLENRISLPKNGEYYILGEQYNNNYYLAYDCEFFEKDTLLYGENEKSPNAYWAIKISNGSITSSWVSRSPLSEDKLLPYSFDDQKKQIGIFEKKGEKIIGYYNISGLEKNDE